MSLRIYSPTEMQALVKGALSPAQGDAVAKDLDAAHEKMGEASDRTLQFVISTGDVDRDGDTIDPNGWDLVDFQKSGTILWAHDSCRPPIAAHVATWVEGGKLKSRAKFPTADRDPFGSLIYDMFIDGSMKATSVGFMPREWKINEDRASGMRPGVDFLKQSLLEWSAVPVPANPNAIVEAAKSHDLRPLADWATQQLDTKDASETVRGYAAGIHKALAGVSLPKSAVVLPPAPAPEPAPVVTAPAPAPEMDDETKDANDVDTIFVAAKALLKRGRVLSAANEERLRQARDLVDEVVSQVELDDEVDDGKSASGEGDEIEVEGLDEASLAKIVGDAISAASEPFTQGNQP